MTSKQFEQLPRSKQLERFDRYKKRLPAPTDNRIAETT